MRRKQGTDVLLVVDVRLLPLEEREFEPTDAVRQPDGRVAAVRIAPEDRMRRADRIVRDIDHEAVRGAGLALERDAESLASGRRAALCGDDPARALDDLAVGERGDHAIRPLDEVDDLRAEAHATLGKRSRPSEQDPVDQWLHEAVAPRPAELACGRVHLRQDEPVAVDHVDLLVRDGVRQHLVDNAGSLHRPERLVVDADGARVVDELVALLHHEDADAVLTEQVRQRQAHGACADDEDVGGASHPNLRHEVLPEDRAAFRAEMVSPNARFSRMRSMPRPT